MSIMIATQCVYPVGYSAPGSQEYIDGLMSSPKTLLVDTRYKPYSSWNKEFCKEALQAKYGARYKWAGAYLGNLGFKDGYIKLANPSEGIKGLMMYLNKGHDLVLLCKCRDHAKCHRSEIVRLLTEQVQVDIVQFGSQSQLEGQEGALAAESSATDAVAIEPPDLAPDDDAEDDKASQPHCEICGSLGTLLKIPSGRPESVYCESHGYCKRCNTSVEEFVKHPFITSYVCPCIVSFETQRQLNEELRQAKPVAFSF